MQDAIQAVEKGLIAEASQQAETLKKHVLSYDQGERALHMLGAVAPGLGVSGVKMWVQHHATAHPMLMIFDSASGSPLALIEANTLSNLRTGAMAGVASKYLATTEVSVLGVIGSGKQAVALTHAVASVRPLQKIQVWSPNPDNRQSFAQKIQQELGIPTYAMNSAEQALKDAMLVGLTARVAAPVVESWMIAKGAHINSIGTTVSGKSELPLDIFPRFSLVCADSVASVRSSSDEFRAFYDHGHDWNDVVRLADVVKANTPRDNTMDLTVYKGMGTGIADLALASFILGKAGILP
ncbi:MAG: ornithine cyclodeaminase family protein [Burkholderiaceae bacterium]|nr:ornithine cyclodeaminase family protein [Burkholderiaceae bacterium]